MRITDHTLDVPKFEGDVTNFQEVSIGSDDRIAIRSPLSFMNREQALIHAAWIVVLADESENCEEFRRILRKILKK